MHVFLNIRTTSIVIVTTSIIARMLMRLSLAMGVATTMLLPTLTLTPTLTQTVMLMPQPLSRSLLMTMI